MRHYDALTCVADRETLDLLSAIGEGLPITGIVDNDMSLTYYFDEGVLSEAIVDEIRGWVPEGREAEFLREEVEEQNWNAEFEMSLAPVRVAEDLVITQSWNPVEPASDRDLVVVIDPKMSFGTGHHESTRLIARLMSGLDLVARRVLDVGTGTGVLAIVAAKRGASYVEAVDNNEWASNNARENILLNDSPDVVVLQGELSDVKSDEFDVILANIHRNVIIELLPEMVERLTDSPDASILTSGVLVVDYESLVSEVARFGLHPAEEVRENEWIATRFVRNSSGA